MVFCSSLFLRVAGRLAVGFDLTRSLDSGWRGVWCVCVDTFTACSEVA